MKVDLHLHTSFSDGGKSVQDIFDIARANSVKVVSITDHNNIDAYSKLMSVNRHGIKVVQGIEMDAHFDKMDVHIVMYGFEVESEMGKYLQKSRKYDIKEFRRMLKDCERLNDIKFDKSIVEKFILENQYFDKVRLNEVIVKSGLAKTPSEAFYNFTKGVKDKKRYIISAKKLLKIAKKCGGKTFIAHPVKYLNNVKTMENLAEDILKMRAIGLNGVEVYNNRQDETQEKFLLAFAKRNNLMISGGSDFHAKIGANESKTIGSVLNKDIDGKMLSKELFDKVF